jgi:hypothetical protein
VQTDSFAGAKEKDNASARSARNDRWLLLTGNVANEKAGRRVTPGDEQRATRLGKNQKDYLALAVWLRTATHLPSRLAKTSIQAYLPLESLPSRVLFSLSVP